ncbi:hypothetical protein BP6252_06692 [Coleophoma cylindrospora]|uniref:Uncharacterized protein n=1 Tax=Coleophoma cylindrospora TaxID=1849047 RepID=A0A3D8RNL8_9HELO|nr:hypothetical protein BP6252_06692 [Coleophoma cylindrospora]
MDEPESVEEQVPFLTGEIRCSVETQEKLQPNGRYNIFQRKSYITHAILFTLNIVFFVTNLVFHPWRSRFSKQADLYEPSGAPIAVENLRWDLSLNSKTSFTSMDRDVADAAWDSISMGFAQGWVRLNHDKIKQMNEDDSVEFIDGSGSYYGIDVFHQLHCLDYLRKKMFLYNPLYSDTNIDEEILEKYHLRMALTSLYHRCTSD